MASREQNEAMAGLLKQSLARDAASKSACLGAEILAAHFERSLSAAEAQRCELHVSQCSACREQLAAMARAEESSGGDRGESKVRRLWMMNWGWMTAAATIAVLLAVWLVPKPGRMARMNQPAPTPLVAMNRSEAASANAEATARSEMKRAEPSSANSQLKEFALAAKAKTLAKKAPSSAGASGAEGVNVQPSENPLQRREAQSADLSIPMKLAGTANTARQLRQAPSAPQAVGAGQASFAMDNLGQNSQSQQIQAQANQSSQAVTVTQAKQAERARVASAAAPTIPVAGSGAGGTAQGNAPLEGYKTTENKAGSSASVTTSLAKATSARELQTIEQRASGKIINTPLPNVEWRFDTAGYVERSTDSGATWNGQQVDPDGGLLAGSAPNEKVCWVVGRKGLIYVTKNAQTWTKLNPPDSVDLVDVSAKNASSATVKTADGRSFSTQDRGKKWKLEASAKDSTPQ